MIIVANIGGGDDGFFPGNMSVGNAFHPSIDPAKVIHNTQNENEVMGGLQNPGGNPVM